VTAVDDRPDPAGGDAWFDASRFGMFIHWGPYSAMGIEPSWPLVGGTAALAHSDAVAVADYYRSAARWAPPDDGPARWVDHAVACGMDYLILTTKHHDGFTLFPTDHSALGIHTTAPGRDLVGAYVDAVRSAGRRVGFYFSLADWHHPDYPAFRDDMRPYQFFGYPRPGADAWDRFHADLVGQLRDLLTRYGPIDVLWFDGGWERTPDEWRATELEALIRTWQPDVVLNDRLPGVAGYESYPHEQIVPFDPPARRWETCVTMDRSWGPLPVDEGRKSVAELLGLLGDAAGAGGRLLLNVAPVDAGAVPDWQRSRLDDIGRWMDRHGPALHATRPALRSGQFYGPATTDETTLYLWCPMAPAGPVVLRSVHGRRIRRVTVVGGPELAFDLRFSALDQLLGGDPVGDVVIDVPANATIGPMPILAVDGLAVDDLHPAAR